MYYASAVNPCEPNPCNTGDCYLNEDDPRQHFCDCEPGYIGTKCESSMSGNFENRENVFDLIGLLLASATMTNDHVTRMYRFAANFI